MDETQLKAKVELAKDKLLLSYIVTNRSARTLLMFNALHDSGSPVGIDVDLAYTFVEGEQLTVAKQFVDLQPGVAVYVPHVPYARELAAGATFEESFQLDVPLTFFNPQFGAQGKRTIPCTKVSLRIGYALADQLEPPAQPSRAGGEDLFTVKFGTALARQRLLQSPWFSLDLNVVHLI